MGEHYIIICNPLAGKGSAQKSLTKFEQFLTGKGLSYETFSKNYPKDLQKFTCMVIMGGDGTINYVFNYYKEISIPIAFIIGGTGNDYAKLHLRNTTIQEQFEIAIQNKSTTVDAGTCNGKLFINGVGIGFDGWVVKSNLGKNLFKGKMAYYTTIVSLLLFYKEKEITITTPEREFSMNAFMLSIAKGKTYGGGFMVAPLASPGDGKFDLITIAKIGLFKRFLYLPVIEKGKHLGLPIVQFQKTEHIKITSQHALQAHLDGEYMESKTFDLRLLKGHFKIKSKVY